MCERMIERERERGASVKEWERESAISHLITAFNGMKQIQSSAHIKRMAAAAAAKTT